jgi:catechol 2,3-dioxygenase-like lactoylglutathione lyase family enzyme
MAETAAPTKITHIGTVVIPVRDQEAALRFFQETFGFEIRVDTTFGPGLRWIEVAPPGAQTTIAIAPLPEGSAAQVEVSFSTDDAGADHAALLPLGLDMDAALLQFGPDVPPMFTFRDPEGHGFRVVERG